MPVCLSIDVRTKNGNSDGNTDVDHKVTLAAALAMASAGNNSIKNINKAQIMLKKIPDFMFNSLNFLCIIYMSEL